MSTWRGAAGVDVQHNSIQCAHEEHRLPGRNECRCCGLRCGSEGLLTSVNNPCRGRASCFANRNTTHANSKHRSRV